ncbi:MAG TPA: sigma-70 family RNA polymerase sigma factor [Chloroflexota bacterium]|nr:sigma-70 family RNA polymerase sigma factor [Chloroflexota bacterium]
MRNFHADVEVLAVGEESHEQASATVPDEALAVEALHEGEAFEELVRRYQNRIYSLAYRMTGDNVEAYDLTQEAFLRSYAALPSFNPQLRFAPWLYRIATNLCINFLQSSRVRKGGADPDLALQMPDRGKQPDSLYEEKEQRLRIHQAILSLPAKYRAVVILRHMQDKTYEEIAAILDLPLNTVRTHLFRARELLRRRLYEPEH